MTMRLFISSSLCVCFSLLLACNNKRKGMSEEGYEVISEKCFIVRNKPFNDSLQDSVLKIKTQIIEYLKAQQFPEIVVQNDSLLFRRANGQEVAIVLPVPQDAWEANTIIVFDPLKNPLFINPRKGVTQLEKYFKP